MPRSSRARPWLVPFAMLALLNGLGAAVEAAPIFHRALRVNPAQVAGGPLTNFPLLFNSTDPALRTTANGGRVTNINGWDIIFATTPACADSTTCGGNKLDHEIESYNPVTGQLIAWVRVPSLDNGTVIYVHYSDAAVVATTENKPGVWNAGYKGVWHLRETPAGAAGEFKDSTSNANNGIGEVGPASFPTQTAGQIDGSLAFDGTLDRDVNVPNSASLQLATNMTVSGWARTTSADGQARLIVAKWITTGSMRNYWLGKLDASTLNFGIDGGTTAAAALALVNDGLWHHVVGVADASGLQMRIYVDGTLRGTTAWDGTSVTGTSELRIGRSTDATLQDWNGGLDEVRVSSVARSAGWIATEYRNQSSPSTFYSLDGMRVLTGSYVGDGVNGRAIAVLPFRPDVVLISSNELGLGTERQAVIRTSTMIGNASRSIASNVSTPLADRIQSLDAFGFTVGHPSPELAADRVTCVNHTGVTYYWTAFQAADGEMQVGTYPGNGLDNHDVTGVGFQPDYVLVMSADGTAATWQRSSAMAGDLSLAIEGLNGTNRIQLLQADGFQVGTDVDVNQNGTTFHYAAWKAVPGKMAVGTYGGNNGDPRSFTGLGFRPEYVLMRRSLTDDSVMKPAATGSSTDWSLVFRCFTNCGKSNSIQALDRDGFQVGNNTDVNLTGGTYYWAAFGPHVESYYRSIGTVGPYVTGTVSVTNGSTVVTGAGTAWKTANRGRGDRILIGGVNYVVLGVDSETQLRLTAPYAGATAAGLGFTIARQFATLQAWEDCVSFGAACPFFTVSSASLVADGRREVGIAYKDSVFTAPLVIDGSTTDATHTITLTADGVNRNYGLPGTGVVINTVAVGANVIDVQDNSVTVEWMEITNAAAPTYGDGIQVQYIGAGPATQVVLRNNLIHNVKGCGIGSYEDDGHVDIYNNIIHSATQCGVWINPAALQAGSRIRILNNTIYGNTNEGIGHGLTGVSVAKGLLLRNNISVLNGAADFDCDPADSLDPASSNNLSEDGTSGVCSPAGGSVTSTVPAVQFVNAAGGNFHIGAGSTATNAGADLSAVFATDIDAGIRTGVWDIGADEFGATTEVKLQSFSAVAGDRQVLLEWRTASELDNLGFHLYRGLSETGPWTRLTSSLIPGLGSSAVGQAYSFRDAGLQNGTRYFYRLEDVDASSKTTSHGPVSAVPAAGAPGGAPGSEPPSSSPSAKKKGATSASCPDWVVAAYGSMAGASASSATLLCTRHGDPEAVSLAVVSRDSRQATLELKTGGFYALHEPSGKVRVLVPGFDFPQDPQAPALPVRRALVDAVVGRRAQLAGVRALDQVGFPGLVPASLGKAEMLVSRDGTVRAGRGALQGSSPQHVSLDLARLLPSVFQGETKSAVVQITPLRFDARRQQIVLSKRVLVRLLFTARETGESGRGSVGRRERPQKAVTGELLARLYTTGRGLYAASFEQLFPGRQVGLASSQLRLERQGQAQGLHTAPVSDAFGPGSVLYFYADTQVTSTDFSSETAWELWRARDGLQMPLVSAPASGGAITTPSMGQASFKTNRFYQPGLLEAPDLWLWEGLASGATRAKSFSLPGVEAASSPAATLDVFLQGASESGGAIDHHVSVSLNGVPVGEAQFAGKKPYRMSLTLPQALVHEGANELQLTNVADTGVSSLVFLDRFAVSYPQASSLASGAFEGAWAETGTATLSGAAPPLALLDVTASPASSGGSWLAGYESAGGALRFRAEAGHHYVAVSQQALLTPRVAVLGSSNLRATTNQADYLLIAPRAFLAAAEPLLQRRHDQGLTTRGVAFEEISDEFGHGQPSAEAIKAFLSFAFQSWARPSPRYVLLLGDSNYDPRNFMGTSSPSPLPALWTKTSYLWTVSDPDLAAVNGEDALPDLAIGRLPATTVEQASSLIEKLLAWEDSGQGLSGQAVLVADNADLAGDFEANVRDIAQSYLAGRNPQLLLLSELGSELRPRIQDALNGGLSYLDYVGHGGAAVWASENVWNSWDAPSLEAQSRQPFLLTMNCLNGYFVAPAFDSLSESLLKADGRGAIAAFSPSGLSLDGPAHQYHRALMAELTNGRHQRLGDAILAAQRAYAQTGLMPELLSVYHLLGDPAMRIE